MSQVILFDLDGTLLDTSPGVLSSVKYTIEKMGFQSLSEDALEEFIGPPIRKKMAEVYGISDELAGTAMECFRQNYGREDLYKAEAYPGLTELLDELRQKGYLLGVATYKREDQAQSLLEKKGLARFFDVIHGSDVDGKLTKHFAKAAAEAADISSAAERKAIEAERAVPPQETVMIGDSLNDAVGAKEAGLKFIGVLYGFGFKSEKEIEALDHIGIAENCMELKKYF